MQALVLVDLQNDFCPGGALAVPDGDRVIPLVNRLQRGFPLVVATQDWHPPDHGSFAASHRGKRPGEVIELAGLEQILWPVHCVAGTPGAALHPDLACERIAHLIRKGTERDLDSYSALFDNAKRRSTGLAEYLRQRNVGEIYLCGLATEYCVKFSALDAVTLGFRTHVVADACRGIDLRPGDAARALDDMRAAGVDVVQSAETLSRRTCC
jgi:nicotinamidase/pyrazinamidase